MNTAILQNYLRINNDIGAGAQPIPQLVHALSSGEKCVSITSPTEVLQDGQIIALCAVLPLADLHELTLHDLGLNINSWVAIADAASKSKTLQCLRIKDCKLRDGQQSLTMLARAVGSCQLQSLEVVNCKLGDEFVSALADTALLSGDSLATLKLTGCGLSDEGVCRLAKALDAVGMMSSLKVLDLSYNHVGDRGACALAALLVGEGAQSSLPLQALELEANCITDIGCLALARAAKCALVLSRLCISLNSTTDATLHAIAEALRFNTGTLKEVAAAGAHASEDAAVAVIRAAVRNNSLQLLDIRGVQLGPEGVAQLCQLLRYTATLNTLRVDVLSREEGEAIARELPSNRSLQQITLGGPVPEALLTRITQMVAANAQRINSGAPARSSPHIHAWIENATLGNAVSGHTAAAAAAKQERISRQRSGSPGPNMRSPRSEAGGSVYSHGTYTTNKTSRTAATYLSFQFSQMSRKTGISSSPLRLSTSLAAGGAAEKAAVIFRKHDVNQDNYLNRDEMLAALQEVGVFNGIRAKQVGKLLDHEFKKADWDNDGRISLQDFTTYYEKIAYYQTQLAREGRIKSASHKQAIPAGVENNPALKRVFRNYCKYALGQGRVYQQEGAPQMNAQQFHRLVQDAGFVEPDGRLSTTAVDVIFYRYRPVNARRLAYKEFVDALAAVAYEAGMQFEDLMISLGCRGPNPLTPDGSMVRTTRDNIGSVVGSERNSDAGISLLRRPSEDDVPMDPVFSNLGAPHGLASIQELPTPQPTPQQAPAAKTAAGVLKDTGVAGKKKVKKVAGKVSVQQPLATNNPLYESSDLQAALRAVAEAGKVAASEQRARQEMEQRLAFLEARLAQQACLPTAASAGSSNGATGIIGGGIDAGVTAASIAGRLSKLEASLSHALVKQEELEGVSRQMGNLQAVLTRLADEMSLIKAATSTPSSPAPAVDLQVSRQVESLSGLVGQLAGDVRGLLGRVDGLAGQLASVTLEHKTLSMRVQNNSMGGGSAVSGSAVTGGAGSSLNVETVTAIEKRLSDRQARFEGALMQVARQVDVLDSRLKEKDVIKDKQPSLGGSTVVVSNKANN